MGWFSALLILPPDHADGCLRTLLHPTNASLLVNPVTSKPLRLVSVAAPRMHRDVTGVNVDRGLQSRSLSSICSRSGPLDTHTRFGSELQGDFSRAIGVRSLLRR